MHHMDQITSVNFLSDPHVINQTVRGEIFILIDAILNFSFANDVSEHIKTFIEFFERFIKFFVDYLSILPTLIKDVNIYIYSINSIYIYINYINSSLSFILLYIIVCRWKSFKSHA